MMSQVSGSGARATANPGQTAADAELAGLPKVWLVSAFPISEGTVLLLEFESPLKDRTFNIWFRPCRSDP